MIPAKKFYMIRHGETEHNAAKILAGSTDSMLTDKGRAQARAVQNVMDKLDDKPKLIVHSPLTRARDTATIINEVLNVPMIEDADIAEHFCGDWEGKPYAECADILNDWKTPPNGESFDDFCARIRRCKTKVLESYQETALIVCHGGVFRGFGRLYGLNTPGIFKNCHLYEFEPKPKDTQFPWRVWSYGLDQAAFREENQIYSDSPALSIA